MTEYLEDEIASLSKNDPFESTSTPAEDNSKKRKIEGSTVDLPAEMPSIFNDVD